MFEKSNTKNDSVVVLFKGGRLSSWYDLSSEHQDAYSVEHIALMKSVANTYKMMKLEGYKLLSPINDWQRFWTIEFPTFEGAEAWIKAETEPPYGRYGYYNYYLAHLKNNSDTINNMIDYNRDYNIDFFGFKTLERAYQCI